MSTGPKQRILPGEVGLWVFIFCDLSLFSLLFGLAVWDMGAHAEAFARGNAALDLSIGMVNTLVLLTGSWAVAMATRVVRGHADAGRYLFGAAASGILFLLLKIFEYGHLLGEGHAVSESPFFMWYFILTGYHAMHVMVGIGLLFAVAREYRLDRHPGHRLLEAAGCYWHLVDLLWVGIFLILYLL